MTTPSDLIDRLGGVVALSKRLGLPENTVSNWRLRGSIPLRYHAALLQAVPGQISADELIAAHARFELPPSPEEA